MNELIKQLADQAHIGLFEDKSFGWSVIAGTDQHLSKFAELIVRECANVCKSMDRGIYKEVDDPTLIDVAVKIKQHFGVSDDDSY